MNVFNSIKMVFVARGTRDVCIYYMQWSINSFYPYSVPWIGRHRERGKRNTLSLATLPYAETFWLAWLESRPRGSVLPFVCIHRSQ